MKNKVLPLSLVTLVIFLGAFLISSTVSFQESFLSDPDNDVTLKNTNASQDYIAQIRNNKLTNSIAFEDELGAFIQTEELVANSYKEDFDWQFLGPDNVSGFTSAILYDNSDTSLTTIIAGAFTGGLYKSTNSGLTWNKINGIESSLRISCIAQASDGTIYAGTGGYFIGSGIYKSTDGETFTVLASTDPTNGGLAAFAYVNALEINPTNGSLYASTDEGIFYSNDQGETWNFARATGDTPLLGVSTDVNIGSNGITAASLDGLCYISEDGNPNNFVLHSSDTFNLPYENIGALELAIAPSNPDILYATVLDVEDVLVNIYTSEDKGVHWRVVAPGGSTTLNLLFNDMNNVIAVFPDDPGRILVGGNDMWEGKKYDETGYYQWTQRSFGQIPPQVFPSYIHTFHYSYLFRPGKNNELLIGHNGGISRGMINSDYFEFAELTKTYTTSQAMTMGISGTEKFVIGGFNQAGVQYINGHQNPANAKNAYQIWAFLPPWGGNGGEVFLSIMDQEVVIYSDASGEFRRSEDLGFSTSNSFLGEGMPLPEEIVPSLYWENFDNDNSRDSVAVYVSNPIETGTTLYLPSNNRGYPFLYTTEITYQVGDTLRTRDPISTKFFIGSENAVWMTTDILDFTGTPEWFQISEQSKLGVEGIVSAMAFSADANYVYVGTQDGRVFRIANIALAYNYERADVRSPYCVISTAEIPLIDPVTMVQNTNTITSICVDPQDENSVVLGLGNYGLVHYLFKSDNATAGDASFQSAQGNLPSMPVYASIIEMSNSSMCIVGTDFGVFETQDINASSPEWNASQGLAGKTPVFALKQQVVAQPMVEFMYWNGEDTVTASFPGTDNYGIIYAAANGRGLFYSNKYQKPVGIISNDLTVEEAGISVYPNPASSNTTIEYELNKAGSVIIRLFDINGKMMTSEQFTQAEGSHKYQFNCSQFPTGMYIISLQTGNSVKTSKFIIAH
ncbi:MAG: hypothetical protein DRJ15_01510 [Bacteroidetes bacterium]|nr:MAG: hypothetical protein DRJ15_01510 [Bacteroidota bacterium]